jgi:hypothetical protein
LPQIEAITISSWGGLQLALQEHSQNNSFQAVLELRAYCRYFRWKLEDLLIYSQLCIIFMRR